MPILKGSRHIFLFLFVLNLVVIVKASGQDNNVLSDNVFSANIRTVQLYVDPLQLSDPAIPLNGVSQLHLAFDDLDGDKKNYYYTLILCNFDWTPSDLNQFDYLDGFQQQEIVTFNFSFNTNQRYTHYDLLFPNQDIRITKSGNYILKVYPDNDPDHPVLTRRFIVFENKVQVVMQVHQPMNAQYTETHQEVDFVVNYSGIAISNPQSDIHALIMQNFRWDNAITTLTPLFLRTDQLDYNYEMDNAFPAGKEFRNFDTRALRYHTEHVKDIQIDDHQTNVFLFPDPVRSGTPYLYRTDINGRFIPGTQDYPDQSLQSDYCWVHFSIPFDYPLKDGTIYIFGQFTEWKLLPDFKMEWNPKLFAYEGKAYLKQGYYEYEYMFLENKSDTPAIDLIEGNSYETENTYQVFIYYRPFGARYDQVIGFHATNSFNK